MHVPVIMVTALDQTADRVLGLEAGADDFLTKPVDDVALITRVRNLARLKSLSDEMMLRMATGVEMGAMSAMPSWSKSDGPGRILLVEDQVRAANRMLGAFADAHEVCVETDPQAALRRLGEEVYDLLIVSLNLGHADGLRLCGQARALDRSRRSPIIVMAHPGDEARVLRALDIGVNDYLTHPIDRNELLARVRTQIRRKRHCDHLRGRLEESVELAVTDPLTGLHNRRYMETHLKALAEQSVAGGRPLTVVLADIDNFKAVNDTFGHDAGDRVLREFAGRLRRNTRSIDLACRMGGEEFVIIMPDTGLEGACQVAERLRECIAAEPFRANVDAQLTVTASVGVATLYGDQQSLEDLLKRADQALYVAKRGGRNRVVADAA